MNAAAERLEEFSCEGFAADGFTVLRSLLARDEVQELKSALAALAGAAEGAGVRGLLQRSAEIAALARRPALMRSLAALAGAVPFAVRGILFDKNAQANWRVTWHQDVAIALQARADVPGFGPWSVKAGVIHAHAPASVLERMLTVRIHLDDAGEENGALQVIRGSQALGRLDEAGVAKAVREGEQVLCAARVGDALVMRPLLLHSSAPAARPSHRRVIHLEYAVEELPDPLQWFERIA